MSLEQWQAYPSSFPPIGQICIVIGTPKKEGMTPDSSPQHGIPPFRYPDLPISRHRQEIAAALRKSQVVIVVGETGSGKTTQLPKIALEVAGNRCGKLGCTQPRRLAAVAIARRLAEEIGCETGGYVGYQVRFDDCTGPETRLKLMTDGILLAETQDDPDLRQYHTIILDEAHERSLNIDFLLGYMKLLLARRKDLKLIISSATMDAGAFSEFFEAAPVVHVEGRTYHVDFHYMPPSDEGEELPLQVARALRWLSGYDDQGDVLVFLPGEREIRECADELEALEWPSTDILPLFARLGLKDQQRIFHPTSGRRRVVLATNVAETSLTIPGIIYVIDSGLARISRYLPGKQIQRLQVEPISQASARQRAGRCGRVTEGVCIRLFSQEDFEGRDAYTDPEIKRCSLAGVILRMADLHLPPLGEFPLPDPPSPRLINEGYKTLREIGALDKNRKLTAIGRRLARLPLDPRLGRMLLEAEKECCLAEMIVIVAGLSIMDPRERPLDFATQADQVHAQWKNADSDFLSLLSLWRSTLEWTERGRVKRNQLRKWCVKNYVNFLRTLEWRHLVQDLASSLQSVLHGKLPVLPPEETQASAEMIHRSLLAGVPLQFGLWCPDDKVYRGAGGREFSLFPGSSLFRRNKRAEWVFGTELVETQRLWLRRAAVLDPAWVERVAPHLCSHHAYDAAWDQAAGVVYAKERVVCGGLTIIDGRRISYARYDPAAAREILIREGLMGGRLRTTPPFLRHLEEQRRRVRVAEDKRRRRDLIWCQEGVYRFFDTLLPADCVSQKALDKWRENAEKKNPKILFIPYEDCVYPGEDSIEEDMYPDEIEISGERYAVYYSHSPGEEDDGVTLGVHIDQLAAFPEWLPGWGVPAHLADRAEILLRSLPKELRTFLQPIADAADDFAAEWEQKEPDRPIEQALADFVKQRSGKFCNAGQIDLTRLPSELVTKIWVCDDQGKELAFGTDVAALRERLAGYCQKRFHKKASRTFSNVPMTRWDCGELPLTVEIGNGIGYPALHEDGERVHIKVFAGEDEAAIAHRYGVRRLALLRHGDFINSLRKKLPIKSAEAKLALATIGSKPGNNALDTLYAAMDATLSPLPRNAEEFEASCLRMRENIYDMLAGPLSKIWEQLSEPHALLREFCLTSGRDPYSARIADDLKLEWGWLTRPYFLSSLAPAHLPDHSRFIRGFLERMKRIRQQPLARELERIENFHAAILPEFYAAYEKQGKQPAWQEYGQMVAEYRLSVFAPALAVKGRASTKKLATARERLSP